MKAPTSGKQYSSNDSKRSTSSRSYSPSRKKDEARSKLQRATSAPKLEPSRKRLGSQDSSNSLATQASSTANSRSSGGGSGRKDVSPTGKRKTIQVGKQAASEISQTFEGIIPGRAPRHSMVMQARLGELADALPGEREGLLLANLETCTVLYDFRLDTMAREKEVKRQTLAALIEHINTATKTSFTECFLRASLDMVSANIFRTLEFRERSPVDLLEFEDEEPFCDVAWPHLQLVYEFLRLFISSKEMDPKVTAKFFGSRFVTKLLSYLDADDHRERESIKLVMQRYYSRFTNMRSVVRRTLQLACIRAAHEIETPNGLAELLELESKVINGFTMPLKKEQVDLLTQVLLPLHKVDMYFFFHRQLIQCMYQFVERDAALCYDIVKAILLFWPYTCGSKQVLFIEELESLVLLLQPNDFLRLRDEILRRITLCVQCPNSLVAERALQLWSNSAFVKLLVAHREHMFPDIISALYRNATEHWYGPVHGRTFDVLKMLMEADETLFAESSAQHRRDSEDRERIEERRTRRWQVLHELHERKVKLAAAAKAKPRKAVGKAKGKAKGPMKKHEPQHREDADMLVSDNYGVSVSAENASAMDCMDLQALIIDSRGDIVSVVSQNNFTSTKAAVVHTPCTELNASEENGNDRRGFRAGAAIWITLSRLPPNVKHVFFLLVTVDSVAARREPLRGCMVRLINGASRESTTSFASDADPSGVAILATIERPTPDGKWSFARLPAAKGAEVFGRSGAHYADVLDTVNNLIREAIINVTKPQRVSLVLERGSVADLLHGLAPKGIFFGAGWDFSNRGYADETLAVDVAAVFFGSGGKELGVVCAETPSEFGVRHSGSGMLSAGVAFSFDTISKEVSQIFLVAHVSTPRMTCEMLQNPSCRIIDQNGVGILQFTMGECFDKPGIILGRISLELGRRKWCFQAIGHYCGGHSWRDKETLSELHTMFHKSLTEFQRQLDDAEPVALTSSGRMLASI